MCNCTREQNDDVVFFPVNVSLAASQFQSMRPQTLAAGVNVTETLFASSGIDRILSSSFVDVNGSGNINIRGNVGLISVDISVGISVSGSEIELTLDIREPIKVGPLKWKFGASGSTLQILQMPSQPAQIAGGLNWWCVAKCAGLSILPTLVACLPTLAGGPPAYIACVTAKVGTADAAAIAACIASKCV